MKNIKVNKTSKTEWDIENDRGGSIADIVAVTQPVYELSWRNYDSDSPTYYTKVFFSLEEATAFADEHAEDIEEGTAIEAEA